MPQMAGPLVPHTFRKTTVVGNSHVFFPGKVELPKRVLEQHLREVELAKAMKLRQAEEMGLTLEEMASLEAQRAANTETDEAGDGAKDEE